MNMLRYEQQLTEDSVIYVLIWCRLKAWRRMWAGAGASESRVACR